MNRVRHDARARRVARVYDWSVPLERDALRIALQLANVQRGERVLDVATGTGALLRELAQRNQSTGQVIGVDHSPSMLSGARGLPSSVRLVVADARALPFPSACFDVISLCYLVHLLQPGDRRRVFDAVRRVVRPGGRIVTVTVDTEQPVLRWVLGLFPSWTGLRRLDPRPDMERAGLRPIQARYTRAGWPSLCVLAEPV